MQCRWQRKGECMPPAHVVAGNVQQAQRIDLAVA
jgi:hypothetical protein